MNVPTIAAAAARAALTVRAEALSRSSPFMRAAMSVRSTASSPARAASANPWSPASWPSPCSAGVTGPSIPKCFGIHGRAVGSEDAILPVQTETGIQLMSVNLLLEHETDPVIWRGPVIGGVVQQFWGDVLWQDVDYMFVDMPPGTGDVALNVFQTLPVDGVIIVTSPQDLVGMVVEKAVKMAQMLNIPIVGLVENMSYLACPDCGRKIYLFGEGKTQEAADRYGLPLLAQMPIDPALAALVDAGRIEDFQGSWLSAAADRLEC